MRRGAAAPAEGSSSVKRSRIGQAGQSLTRSTHGSRPNSSGTELMFLGYCTVYPPPRDVSLDKPEEPYKWNGEEQAPMTLKETVGLGSYWRIPVGLVAQGQLPEMETVLDEEEIVLSDEPVAPKPPPHAVLPTRSAAVQGLARQVYHAASSPVVDVPNPMANYDGELPDLPFTDEVEDDEDTLPDLPCSDKMPVTRRSEAAEAAVRRRKASGFQSLAIKPSRSGPSVWSEMTRKSRVLLVGEDDFSFPLCLARYLASGLNICATSLRAPDDMSDLLELVKTGATVNCATDIRRVNDTSLGAIKEYFDYVIWNRPPPSCSSTKEVSAFLHVAQSLAARGGCVVISVEGKPSFNVHQVVCTDLIGLIQRLLRHASLTGSSFDNSCCHRRPHTGGGHNYPIWEASGAVCVCLLYLHRFSIYCSAKPTWAWGLSEAFLLPHLANTPTHDHPAGEPKDIS